MSECELCNGSGWTGDNNAGIDGNTEVHACSCIKGQKIEKAITLLGFDVARDIVQHASLIERIEKLEKKNKELQNEICDLKGFARLHDVSEYLEK